MTFARDTEKAAPRFHIRKETSGEVWEGEWMLIAVEEVN